MHLRPISLLILLATTACGGSDKKGTSNNDPAPAAPIASAPTDIVVSEGALVILDASSSTDPNGDALSFSWAQTAGPSQPLTNPDSVQASFTAPDVGQATTFRFEVTVTDPGGLSSITSVNVLVFDLNVAPTVVIANIDPTPNAMTMVSLDASGSSDSDGTISDFLWTQISGPMATITAANTAVASVTLPDVTRQQTVAFVVEVTDNEGKIATATASILVQPVVASVAFVSDPTSALRNSPITPLAVAVQNSSGQRIFGGSASQVEITLSVKTGTGAGGATLGGTLTQTTFQGLAAFEDVYYDTVHAGLVLEATSTSPVFVAETSAFDVTWPSLFPGDLTGTVETNVVAYVSATGSTFDTIVAGRFSGSVDFTLDASSTPVASSGWDGFIARYAQADGALQWVRIFSSAGDETVTDATTLANGTTVATLSIGGLVNFAQPAATAIEPPVFGGQDTAVVTIDGAGVTTGAVVVGGAGTDEPTGIATDSASNIFVTGTYNSASADFDPGAGNTMTATAGGTDGYILKLTSALGFGWVYTMGGTTDDALNDVGVSSAGTLFVAGTFSGDTIDLDPTAGTDTFSTGASNALAFAQSYTLGDSSYNWTQVFGGPTGNNAGLHVSPHLAGGVALAGTFSDTGDFDPGAGTFELAANGEDIFVVTLNASGTFVNAGAIDINGDNAPVDFIADAMTGRLYLAGVYRDTVDFAPKTTPVENRTAPAGRDAAFAATWDANFNFVSVFTWGASTVNLVPYAIAHRNSQWTAALQLVGGATIDLDPSPTVVSYTASGASPFFLRMDDTGALIP